MRGGKTERMRIDVEGGGRREIYLAMSSPVHFFFCHNVNKISYESFIRFLVLY